MTRTMPSLSFELPSTLKGRNANHVYVIRVLWQIHLFAEGIDILDIVAKLLAVSAVNEPDEVIMWKDTIRQKLVVITIYQQPTYADFVNYAEENLSGSLVGITNAGMQGNSATESISSSLSLFAFPHFFLSLSLSFFGPRRGELDVSSYTLSLLGVGRYVL